MERYASVFIILVVILIAIALLVAVFRLTSKSSKIRVLPADCMEYKALAERSIQAQTEVFKSFATIQSDLAYLKTRITSIESILKEVQ